MKLELKRRWLTAKSTVGELFVDGVFECFVLEDRYRAPGEQKVSGATAIPCGTYALPITQSPRFKRPLPLVENVPGFRGVRIHPGNTADDTEGCLLPGQNRHLDRVSESRAAFEALFAKLVAARDRGESATITITVAPQP